LPGGEAVIHPDIEDSAGWREQAVEGGNDPASRSMAGRSMTSRSDRSAPWEGITGIPAG